MSAAPLAIDRPSLELGSDGVVRVGGTRVTLDTVVEAFGEGDTPEQIVQDYSSLRLVDVYEAIGYYLRNRREVDAYLQRRRQEADEVQRRNEERFPRDGIRERLLGRRHGHAGT